MALTTLTSSLTATLTYTAAKSQTGDDYGGVSASDTIQKRVSVGTAAGNAVANGGDEVASFITSIAASGNASIDLTSLTDIVQQSGVSLARVKAIVIRLLSVADDATNGTACTHVTIGNGSSNDWITGGSGERGWFANATDEFVIPNGGFIAFGTPNAAGVTTSGTRKIIYVVNEDAAVAARVQVSILGGTS